jgi:hypothetical protein
VIPMLYRALAERTRSPRAVGRELDAALKPAE